MALARSNLTASYTDTDGTSFTTASISPTANALVVLTIFAHDNSDAPELPASITGTNWANGLTWTLINSINVTSTDDGGTCKVSSYKTIAPGSVSAGTITATFSATHEKYVWHVEQFTDSATPDVLQSKAAAGLNDQTATLDVAPSSISGSLAVGAAMENTGISFASGLTNGNYSNAYNTVPQINSRSGYTISSPPTSATADIGSPSDNAVLIYMEVGQPAAGIVIDPLSNQIPGIPVVDPLGQ